MCHDQCDWIRQNFKSLWQEFQRLGQYFVGVISKHFEPTTLEKLGPKFGPLWWSSGQHEANSPSFRQS